MYPMRKVLLLAFSTAFAASLFGQEAALQTWMYNQVQNYLTARESAIANVLTSGDAELRKNAVRSKILESMGGLPNYNGPLNPIVTGRIDFPDYFIEKIQFESLPNFFITANLYVPRTPGRYPGILMPLGHWDEGKINYHLQKMAANFALKGFVALTYDPIGQGERPQGTDPITGLPLAGQSVSQHLMAGAQTLLLKQNFARYRIWDAHRGLDLLVSRPEVDPDRLGVTGCSGGGTITGYIAALDDRVKVAAPACSTSTYRLMNKAGVGDSEQSLPSFLTGLDHADYVELFAPKPWLILSTEGDYFTPAGGQLVYQEAQRWYGLYGAQEKLSMFIGPGGHGWPYLNREADYGWMIRWLKDGVGDPHEQVYPVASDSDLQVTSSGRVGGRQVYELIRETPRSNGTLPEMIQFLKGWVRHEPATPSVTTVNQSTQGSLIVQDILIDTEPGMQVQARLLIPPGPGSKPAVLLVQTTGLGSQAATDTALAGNVVLELLPRGLPTFVTTGRSGVYEGDWTNPSIASMIGRSLAGMRALDILRGVDLLASRPEVDPTRIGATANNNAGIWLLVAAAVDSRLSGIALDHTPYSLRLALDGPVHYDLHEAIFEGFALKWDLSNLVSALGRRTITWTNPTDWLRNVVPMSPINPRLSATVVATGVEGGQFYVDLRFANTGPNTALGITVSTLSLRTLSGTGSVTAASALPLDVGDIAAASSRTIRVLLNRPASATRFSMSEGGQFRNQIGSSLTFSLSQAVAP
jgi:cephalosporin-C deacetylase-like acetyl esterase